jgi:hypothetical protein
MRRSSLLLAMPLLLLACSAKDAVSLSVRISQSSLTVKNSVFTTGGSASGSLSGTFQVALTVGPEASGSSTVTEQSFTLQTQSGASLVDVLMVDSDTQFPLVVGKGETKTVTFTIAPSSIDHDAACAGQVKIIGSFGDSLNGATESAQSDPITPTCPAAT